MGQGALELALDEGEGIVNEGLADAVALGGDPVSYTHLVMMGSQEESSLLSIHFLLGRFSLWKT